MNLLEHLALHLDFEGLGTAAAADHDGDIHWGLMPDAPDDCICCFSTDSGVPGEPSGARIQIYTRSRSNIRAYERAVAITETLEGFHGFLHGDGPDVSIETINSAAGLGADSKQRALYASNFRVRYCDY